MKIGGGPALPSRTVLRTSSRTRVFDDAEAGLQKLHNDDVSGEGEEGPGCDDEVSTVYVNSYS